jgi:hypothetical protein
MEPLREGELLALPLREGLALTLGDAHSDGAALVEAASDPRALGLEEGDHVGDARVLAVALEGDSRAEPVAALREGEAVGDTVTERGPPTAERDTRAAFPYTASPLWSTVSAHVPPALLKVMLPVLNVPGRAPGA